MNNIFYALSAGFLILLGGLGSILPILPGPPLSFIGLWLYAWATAYEKITPTILIVFGVLTILTFVVDFIAPALGAKGHKASRYGVIGSTVGAFAGIFLMGPFGLIAGPFIGAFLGEMYYARNTHQATKVAIGSFIGFLIGSFFKLVVIIAMFAYFIYALF